MRRSTAYPAKTYSRMQPAPSSQSHRVQAPITSTALLPKHAKHWSVDGNLIVQLDGERYKLYRGRIVQISGWFTDALANPDPDIVGQETQGDVSVSVVKLDGVGVRKNGWDALLDAMDEAM